MTLRKWAATCRTTMSAPLVMAGHLVQHSVERLAGCHTIVAPAGQAAIDSHGPCCQLLILFAHFLQVDTPWRKAVTKLEGDPAFEALDKIDRLEVFQEYIKCAFFVTLKLLQSRILLIWSCV